MKFANLKEVFGIDHRSLALFRIALALLLLFDLTVRANSLVAHYTDEGILPRADLIAYFANPFWISVHMISGNIFFQGMLFIIAGIFAFALLVGYKTRLATIVSWFFLISIHSRNPFILQGGDILFRMILFWAMFLPLGKKYSIDSLNKKEKQKEKTFFSFGTVGILLQVALVYFFSALLKTGKEWYPEGTAIYYALSIDQFATPFGKFLLNFPELLTYFTYIVLFFELLGPFFLFIPIFFGQVRTLFTFLFFLLISGMGLSLYLGPFPWISVVAFLVFLPTWFWDKFSPLIRKTSNSLSLNKLNKLKDMLSYIFIKKIKPNKLFYYSNKKISNKAKLISYFVNIMALFFIIYIFLWNIQTLGYDAVPNKVEFVAHLTRVDQLWNMFSPYPLKGDGWYVFLGELANGKKIDLLQEGKSVNWEKPKDIALMYENERWRKYTMNLWLRDYAQHRKYYSIYLCKEWNNKHNNKEGLKEIKMFYMLELTLPDYEKPDIEKILLYEQKCFEEKK